MGKTNTPSTNSLRQQAEEILRSRLPFDGTPLSEADTLKLVHELQISQIELELQNEELLRNKRQDLIFKNGATKILDLIDFEEVNKLLEGFNQTTGFVTAILDLEGNVLSKSGWRQICTEFHRINSKSSRNCSISDTVLANELGNGERYHFYQCLNGLVDVAAPLVINEEHIANLFSGQFFFEEPDRSFFKQQAKKYNFNEQKYLTALENVPVVSKEQVKVAMNFLLDMTQLISKMTFQKLEQAQLNEALTKSEERYRLISDVVSDYIFTSEVHKNGKLGLTWVTGAFERITGYSFDEYIARGGWRAALHPDDIEKDIHDFEELKKNNKVISDVRTFAKDGRIVWVRVYAHPVWDLQNNELVGIYGGVKDVTESKLAENELANSEARLHTLVQTIPDLIWLKDINGVYLSCNVEFERFYGAKEADIIGKTDYDFVDRELADSFRENDLKAIELGKPTINDEWITFSEDGHVALFEATKTPMYSSSGKLIGVLGIGHDITKRKKAEEALRESELQLSSIYSTVGNIIFYLAVEGKDKYRFISVNQAFCKSTGLNEEMVIGKLVNEVIPEPSLSIVLRKYNQAIQEKSVIRWEETSEYPTGMLMGDVSIAPVFDDKGHCTHLVGSVHNITERKQIEVALKESNERLKVILENNPIAIWDWNIKTDKWFATQNYYTMLGYEPESNNPDRTVWLNRIHPDDRENVRIKISNILNSADNQYSYEARMLHADGSYRWQTVLGKAIDQDEDGNVSHMIGVRIDTDDRKHAEQELIIAKERAEASDKLKTAFLNNISHEIRTPLNGILGFGEILTNPAYSELEKEGYYRMLNESCDRLINTVTNIMDISLLTSGNVKIVKSEVLLYDLIKPITEKFKSYCQQKNIKIILPETSFDENFKIYTDEELLGKIFHQLIDNAIKFTSQGTITIGGEKGKSEYHFFVKDTGIGISEGYKNRIFGHFEQEDFTITRRYDGTGIGLPIAKGMVELLGGKMWMDSVKGKGSTFHFSIPIELNDYPNLN